MKPIPLKVQKIVLFIPVINLILFVIWCYNDHIMKIPQKDSMVATLLACISSGGVLWVCKMIETALFPQCAYLYMLGYYLSPIAMGIVLIKTQDRFFIS